MIDFVLTEEIQKIQSDGADYHIPNEIDLVRNSDQDLARYLNEIADSIQVSAENIADPVVFDKIRSFLKHFNSIQPRILSRLFDIILSAYRVEIKSVNEDIEQNEKDTFNNHRLYLELYSYLVHWFLMLAEDTVQAPKNSRKSKATNFNPKAFDWNSQKLKSFDLASWLLDLKLSKIWTLTPDRVNFVALFTKPAYMLFENPLQVKSRPIKDRIFRILSLCIKHYEHLFVAQTTIMQYLQYWEHCAEPMAELLVFMVDKENYTQLADEILREISNREFKDTASKEMKDSPNPKTFALFLQKLADLSPKTILKNLVMLINQLDSDSYMMRSTLIEILGSMIIELTKTSQDNPNQVDQINDFFDILEQRMLDPTAHARLKVLQVYIRLFELKFKFPKRRDAAAVLAIRHLQDKSSLVRKYAIRLLTVLLSTHPFSLYGGELNLEEWKTRSATLKAEIENVTTEENATPRFNPAQQQDTEMTEPEKQDQTEEPLTPSTPLPTESVAPKVFVSAEKLQQLILMRTFHMDAIQFIEKIHIAIPTIAQLLSSKSKAEVLESMDFLVVAFNYKVKLAGDGIKKMLHLIWTKDTSDEGKGIKMKLLSCYKSLYLEKDAKLSQRENTARIAKNLIELTNDTTLAELTSLEQVLSTLMNENEISNGVIEKLWSVYGFTKGRIQKSQRRGAIIILGMLAKAQTTIVSDKIDVMLKFGLGPLGKSDLNLAKYTCIALQRLEGVKTKEKGRGVQEGIRFPLKHHVFSRLKDVIENSTISTECLAEQAINTIYVLCENPEILSEEIIKDKTVRVFGLSDACSDSNADMDPPSEAMVFDYDLNLSQQVSSTQRTPVYQKSNELSQLLFLVGHVALKQTVHLEIIEAAWKRKKNKKEIEEQKTEIEDELEQVGGTTEDDIGDAMIRIREREILFGQNSLLGRFGPLLTEVCARNKVYTVTATLALAKFMCVSSEYCERNLQLLFTILEKSTDATIRSNIVIALGDMAVCFSTLIDDNITFLYNRLSDTDVIVRKNTVMVLTHLILNGMIKVKGQISEMAKCLEDTDQRIVDLAKLFFTELSSKDNAIYNNLPDIISNLTSSQPVRLEEESFRRIMKFIFSFDFTEKEKQAENIIDKLCLRFSTAQDERNWRDIAYCLSLLPFKSEKSFKKLLDGWPCYQDKIHEDAVHKSFLEIITKGRFHKNQKPELKALVDEFEQKIDKQKGPELVVKPEKITKKETLQN
ncbi:non-SMC mitotic condensation complex subunit 1-domain-containing protein [Helicostylum pulchrum]|nr:non-SMC mitotic condensation complex subunit 1-domain-containing protein [Helicostylum pulchrum]